MNLTTEQTAALLHLDDQAKAKHIQKKLQQGKPLSPKERAYLAGAQTPESGFAPNWDTLADQLGCDRRSLYSWRNDPRYQPDAPADRADGRKEVAAWKQWMIRHGLKRADEHVDPDGFDLEDEDGAGEGGEVLHPPRVAGKDADWKRAISAEKFERARMERWKLEGILLVAAELEVPLGAMLAAVQTKLMQFPDTAARRVKGLRDEAECADALRDEIDALLRDLSGVRFDSPTAVAEAVDSLPFSPETESLLAKLTFGGEDRAAFMDLVKSVATEALRTIGRDAIAHVQRTEQDTDTAIADEATGQVSDAAQDRESERRQSEPAPDPAPVPVKKPRKPARKARKRTKTPRIPPAIEAQVYQEPKGRKRRK